MQARSNLLPGGALVLAAAAVFAAGCADQTNPAGPPGAAKGGTSPLQAQGLTIDERFVQMARQIPGFGGYYRDGEGNLVAVLTNPSAQGEAARSALASVPSDGRGGGVITRQGRYDFAQLHAWRQQVDAVVLPIGGVAFTDVNEVTNRVEIGISAPAARARVRDAVGALSIPQAAVALVDADALEEHATLKERVRPTTGGLKITYMKSDGRRSTCTLGFSVVVNGKLGYFTNSHCTRKGTGTVHWQPEPNDRIGEEVQDPVPYPHGSTQAFNGVSYTCGDTTGCRFSDASRGVFDDSVQAQVKHGYIARTLRENEYTGGSPAGYDTTRYTIDSGTPYFRIVGKAGQVVVGDVIHKVGRTTGWTSGTVDRTCVNTSRLFCQLGKGAGSTELRSWGGDSGSPVFRRVPGSETDVELVGLLWGSEVSPIANIERDMGMTFEVAANAPPLVILPPDVIGSASPSAVLVDGATFVFYKGATDDPRIYMTRNGGTPDLGTWTPAVPLPDPVATSDAPSAVVIGSTIHVVYRGAGGDAWVYVARSSTKGQSWTVTRLPSDVNTSTRPEAYDYGGSLYVLYKGVEGDQRVYVARTPGSSIPFVPLPADVSTSLSPSAVRVNDTTFIFHKGAGTDAGIYMTRSSGGPDQGPWTSAVPLPGAVNTSDAPSAVAVGSNLYVVYKGSGGDAWVYVARSLDGGKRWSMTRMPGVVNTTTRPDAFAYGNSLYVVYKGFADDQRVYVAPVPVNAVWQPI